MAASSSSLLCIFSILSLMPAIISITIPLSHFNNSKSPDPYKHLNHLVSSSLSRAHNLKNPRTALTTNTTTPIFSHSYGGYTISLSFGTPPQTLPFLMDTGSDLVWFPCTRRYLCRDCSFSSKLPPNTQSFIPKLSSTSKILGCKSPKCSWIHHSDGESMCEKCEPGSGNNCSQICPPYLILYGSGTTGGIGLSETLDLPGRTVPGIAVGCSVFSSHLPAGIAGFGRGQASLPSQLGLKKFSYCLLSRRFDDTARSSSLVLDGESDSDNKTAGLSYTPFIKNPAVPGRGAFSVYYYLGLRKITVGGRRVKIPYKFLSPGSDGDGGTIIDSGTTFTFMAREVFELLATEFEAQVKSTYKRDRKVEASTSLRPCFNLSGAKTVSFPEMRLHFKGGADVALPVENYIAEVGDGGAVCLTVVTEEVGGRVGSGGPSIILGNFQMQNFNVEYDLRSDRLGFKQQLCK